ncbi:MAG: hypothetical protein JST50_10435 [Bacteroidetes bacterium]|jgi:hypothetical protein|nr:hypothetical protein [Bacteroidota bacterium]
MKKIITLLLSLVCIFPALLHAQATTKYNDNVSTLDGIIKAYYDVVTVKKGEKPSYGRDSLLHWPGVVVGSAGISKNGEPVFHSMSLKRFHELSDPGLERDGFYEKEISRKVEQFGGIYHVWSTYESRNEPGGPIIERGINSIELYNDGTRFWILGWFFDSERKDNPIPEKYLKKSETGSLKSER